MDIISSSVSDIVVGLYSEIPQVEAIYQRQSDETINIWVFTNNSEYDRELVDRLVSQEADLLDRLPNQTILVRHIPSLLYPDHRDVTGAAATLIYKR